MSVKSIDDFVWAHYESTNSEERFRLSFTAYLTGGFTYRSLLDHVEQRYEEHKLKSAKLLHFKNSLDPSLRNCVDPFIVQQNKLSLAYYKLLTGSDSNTYLPFG
jgi:hypothetical protein